MNASRWKIGSDPEIFLETETGEFVNAFSGFVTGAVKGTKTAPEPTDYGAIQVDGMALELNTRPTSDPVEFSSLIAAGIKDAADRFKCHPSLECVKQFDIDWLTSQHPLSIELGCDPDYDAWKDGAVNEHPDMMIPMRTAGGHVHIGWGEGMNAFTQEHIAQCCSVIKQMDYVLGLWSIAHDNRGALRRKLYGKAGAFRPKSYGVEYRVLSNFWVFDKALCEAVVTRSIAGMRALEDGVVFADRYGTFAKDVLSDNLTFSQNTIAAVEKDLSVYM